MEVKCGIFLVTMWSLSPRKGISCLGHVEPFNWFRRNHLGSNLPETPHGLSAMTGARSTMMKAVLRVQRCYDYCKSAPRRFSVGHQGDVKAVDQMTFEGCHPADAPADSRLSPRGESKKPIGLGHLT
jgi:hypothetical protein